jgi:uncharacterized protein
MPTYNFRTPGVYIDEISIFPPSIAAVETAIPAFIGFTEMAKEENGDSLTNKPKRLTSLLEFERCFGRAKKHAFAVKVTETSDPKKGADIKVAFETPPSTPEFFLYYSMQLFFANGGGPCYVISIGDLSATPSDEAFTKAILSLEAYDEPTLLVFPDACLLSEDKHAGVVNAALSHCQKMQDRFTIVDVLKALAGQIDDNEKVTEKFRGKVSSDLEHVKYGAAYFPYLLTSLPFETAEDQITIKEHVTDGAKIPADTKLNGEYTVNGDTVKVKEKHTAIYNAVKQFVGAASVTIPPSGGVAGVYARTDKNRGVWKAPANASLLNVIGPAVMVTGGLNDGLNVDATSGKSVNAIRSFAGKGTLVWGARTLAGNDNENRYVSVRRFLIFAEESIKKATTAFVFEPNDPNTWVKVRSMIESFLIKQWRDGALAGAKPEDAFYVSVGLNKTMSAQDILEGYMIVEIGLAIVRPAEFIVLRFAQKMQQS